MQTLPESRRLPPITCGCGRRIESDAYVPKRGVGAPRASGYTSCLRKCDICDVGYSNANSADLTKLQTFPRDRFAGLPDWVAEGCDAALDHCLNQAQGHAARKRLEFESLASEDHATWVVMRFLQRQGMLASAFGCEAVEPVMLIWGVPVPNTPRGSELRSKIVTILRSLHEQEGWFTEPDVILDFESYGLVIVEAKLRSRNEIKKPQYSGWHRYLNDLTFRDAELAKCTGRYQLVRNWRLGLELAQNRPFKLVNLAPVFDFQEREMLAKLRLSFRTSRKHRFVLRRWDQMLGSSYPPSWLVEYSRKRGLLSK
jgi:hypothetical protein